MLSADTNPRYLTKSRFKIGLECPTKLFYTRKPQYPNQSLEDSFMEALAQGGYQVGELAKHYYPGGHDITSLNYEEALQQTAELLEQDKVVIYEAAIRYNNLFIRIDILVKDGAHFDLIEVKAKSFDPDSTRFMARNGKGLLAGWAPYIHDVAFQRHVLAKAFPEAQIDPYLMLVNKNVVASSDGLNTKFRITDAGNNRTRVVVADSLTEQDITPGLLGAINVNDELDYVCQQERFGERNFASQIQYLAALYEQDERAQGPVGKLCKSCEFRCSVEEEEAGKFSGYKECWKTSLGWSDADFATPLVMDIWNFRSADKLMQAGKFKLTDLVEGDIKVKTGDPCGLTTSERQWLQVEKVQQQDTSAYLDIEALAGHMSLWTYPLHFIDFETTSVALPFTEGRHPYEGIAFQFSHHVMHEDGRIEHAGEFLNTTVGHFPNFDFVRALKQQLELDHGTIFKYTNHENTYLNTIYWQLTNGCGLPAQEVEELAGFIQSITHSTGNSSVSWKGERDMVDLWDLVKRFYYDPATNGSTSLKYVLPAILNGSDFIKQKYLQPVYGSAGGIPSKNFSDWTWVTFDGDRVVDPYQLLPKVFDEAPDNLDELLSASDSLTNGGAALTAYAKMQFTEMSDYEREQLRTALLKYCELDTLAMVMIVEAWRDQVGDLKNVLNQAGRRAWP